MKSYVTPMLSFESFDLTSNTANVCGVPVHTQASGVCGLWIGGETIFTSEISGCSGSPVEDDGRSGYCYHQPHDNNRIFNS